MSGRMMRKRIGLTTTALAVLVLIAPASVRADLNAGDVQVNPDVAGAFAYYDDTALPTWFTGFGSGLGNLVSSISGDYEGTVSSSVFALAGGGLGFAYQIDITNSHTGPIEVVDFESRPSWQNVRISAVGSGGAASGGSSLNTSHATTWTDGDPLAISRAAGDGHMGLSFFAPDFFGGSDMGTYLDSNFTSAIFWFEAPDLTSWSGSNLFLQNGGQGQAAILTIPAPGALLLGAIGLGAVGLVRRRFAR